MPVGAVVVVWVTAPSGAWTVRDSCTTCAPAMPEAMATRPNAKKLERDMRLLLFNGMDPASHACPVDLRKANGVPACRCVEGPTGRLTPVRAALSVVHWSRVHPMTTRKMG